MEKQRLSIVVKQNNLFKKMIFVLSLLIILISILLAVFGVKYNKTKQNLKTVAAQKAAVEQSLSERESLFADEKGSLNGEISKLNEQVSLKREQESRALAEANAGKVVYLTFDDGPSPNTPRIIDILNENGVKATFFVKNGGKYNGYMKNITESRFINILTIIRRCMLQSRRFLTICRKYPISYTMKRESVQTYFVFPEAAAIP